MALSGRKEDLVLCQIYLTSYREFIPKFNLKHHHRNKQLLVRAYIYIYIYDINVSSPLLLMIDSYKFSMKEVLLLLHSFLHVASSKMSFLIEDV